MTLTALRKIQIGDELSCSYNMESEGPLKRECGCGHSGCTGYLGPEVTGPHSPMKTPLSRKRKRARRKGSGTNLAALMVAATVSTVAPISGREIATAEPVPEAEWAARGMQTPDESDVPEEEPIDSNLEQSCGQEALQPAVNPYVRGEWASSKAHREMWQVLGDPAVTGFSGRDGWFKALREVEVERINGLSVKQLRAEISDDIKQVAVEQRSAYESKLGMSWLEWTEGVRTTA